MGLSISTKSPDPFKEQPQPRGTTGTSMDAGCPDQPADLNEIWEVLGALPGALALIDRFLGHIQTLKQANDGLKHSIDAQYNLIHNFFARKEMLIQQPQSSGDKPKKDSKKTKQLSSTKLCHDDLNQHENKTIESLQNVIMSQACMISTAVEGVDKTLKPAIPDKYWKSDIKSQCAKQLFYIEDEERKVKHENEKAHKQLKEKQTEKDKLKEGISSSAIETKEVGINCFLLGDLEFVHKDLEEFVSKGQQSNLDTETHTEDQGDTNNGGENVPDLNKHLNNTQENELLSASNEHVPAGGKLKPLGMILQELGKLFDDARNQCDKFYHTDEMESKLRDTVVWFQRKFDHILSQLEGFEDNLDVTRNSEDSVNEMETEYLAMKTEKEQIEKEFALMKKKNDDLENQVTELRCCHLEKEKALSDAESQVYNLEMSIAKVNSDREQTLQTHMRKFAEKDKELSDYQNQISQYKTVISDLKKGINHWKVQNDNLHEQQGKTENTLREKIAHTSKLEDTITGLKLQSDELKRDIYNFKEDLRSSRREVRELTETNDDLRGQRRELTHKCSKLKENLEAIEVRMSIVTEERDMLRRKQDEIDAENERKRRRKQVSVFLYTPRKGDLFNLVVGEMHTKLLSRFNNQNTDVNFEEVYYAGDITPNRPTIVLCINASRLGTDVSNALAGLQANSNIAVVVLHHKEIHALPNQSSERVLTSTEYKALGGIFDMACLSSRGLYPCDMNTNAVNGLVDFIKQRNTPADRP